MADLSGALLTGANLTGADLSGANLAGADLRDATLTGANFLVADLHNANLTGTNLPGARNLTAQQIKGAIVNGTTPLETEAVITQPDPQPLQPAIPLSPLESPAAANPPEVMSTTTRVTAKNK
jgi:uncharacterized protein YjbI with pentapeptide repeats